MNWKQTEEPGDTPDESNAPFVGTVVLVTVWVVASLLVQRTIEFAETVTVVGLNAKFWMDTSVVPLPGHATDWTVKTDVAVKTTPVMSALFTACVLSTGTKVKSVFEGVTV